MAFTLEFNIEESTGGSYLTFTDTSEWGVDTNPGKYDYSGGSYVWTITLTYNEQDYTYSITAPTHDQIDELISGKVLEPSDFTLSGTGTDEVTTEDTFPDGVYDFLYEVESEETSSLDSYGFYANDKQQVIKNSLGYQPEWETATKAVINEQIRLLRNLGFATDTGDMESFQINLDELTKLLGL